MSYAQQRDPQKHLLGVVAVVGFHLLLVYGLVNGLGRKVVEVMQAPLSVSIADEVKVLPPPPPPPPKTVAPPPKAVTPPPAYVPPVEVPVQAPPPAPVITTTPDPTPPPPVVAPAPAPVAPPAPAVVSAAVACPNFEAVRSQVPYPPQAENLGLSGDVLVEFVVAADGQIKNISAVRSSHTLFTAAATRAVAKFQCVGQGRDVRVKVPFSFRL